MAYPQPNDTRREWVPSGDNRGDCNNSPAVNQRGDCAVRATGSPGTHPCARIRRHRASSALTMFRDIYECHEHSAHRAVRFPIGHYPHDVVDRHDRPNRRAFPRGSRATRRNKGHVIPQVRVLKVAHDIGQGTAQVARINYYTAPMAGVKPDQVPIQEYRGDLRASNRFLQVTIGVAELIHLFVQAKN